MAERSAKQLGLSKADLPNSIIEVISTLNKGGFDAYIVGGGVRDTLMGLNPKDFDAVTDAKPHEVKDLFGKRCRIIGRRFQLAHVYSGRDMIEVATFRAPPNGDAHTTSDGMIVRDNVWGTIEQDFARRDFSINAMYYQPIKGTVLDFCNALDDIKNKTLRLLGDAPVRIEEDPVRLLRALRFKAKLGFEFDAALAEQFHDDNWALLDQVSPHRLYDESQKMFTGGYLVPLLPLLFEYGAIRHLIIYPPEKPTALVNQVAINTDKRIAQGKSINPAFFYAALLWDNYLYQLAKFKKKNMPFHDAQLQAGSKVIERQRIKTAIPRFAEQFIRDIWMLQPKLASPRVKQIPQLAEHPRFRAAFDFLLLREQCNDEANPLSESTNGMGEWWQNYQTLSEKQKQQAIDDFAGDSRRGASKSSRNRNRRRNRNEEKVAAHIDPSQTPNPSTADNSESATQKTTDVTSKSPKQTSNDHTRSRSARYQDHYAQERAQLEKLSLGNLAGEAPNTQNQPSPLFTINADKMAKQVPQQSDIEAQVVQPAPNDKPKDKKEQQAPKKEQQNNSRPTKNNEPVSTQAGAIDDGLQAKADLVLLPKSEPIPNKRRRRQPSQQGGEQTSPNADQRPQASPKVSHNASSKVNDDEKSSQQFQQSTGDIKSDKNADSNSRQVKDSKTVAPSVNPKKPAKTNKTANSTKSESIVADKDKASVADKLITKSERIPATRRRRMPSSTLSVSERKNVSEGV